MDIEKIDEKPETNLVSIAVGEDSTLYMYTIEYSNGIQVSIYEDKPKLGSLTMAYPTGDNVERYVIFSGLHEMFASAVAQIIAKKKDKLVYGSVNLKKDSVVSIETIKELIETYLVS